MADPDRPGPTYKQQVVAAVCYLIRLLSERQRYGAVYAIALGMETRLKVTPASDNDGRDAEREGTARLGRMVCAATAVKHIKNDDEDMLVMLGWALRLLSLPDAMIHDYNAVAELAARIALALTE